MKRSSTAIVLSFWLRHFFLFLVLVVAGCAFSNEGAVDFRRTDNNFSIILDDRAGGKDQEKPIYPELICTVTIPATGDYELEIRYFVQGEENGIILTAIDGKNTGKNLLVSIGQWQWQTLPISLSSLKKGEHAIHLSHVQGNYKIDQLKLTYKKVNQPGAGGKAHTPKPILIEVEDHLTPQTRTVIWKKGRTIPGYQGTGYIEIGTNGRQTYLQFKAKNFSLGSGKETRFKENDALSLHLRTAYIKDFSEMHFWDRFEKGFTRQSGKSTGEIALVANAFEETGDNRLSFEDLQAGRVVFYSNDVHQGQFLNFNNMPIYGPLKYTGAPFAFRIAIFELDVISEQAKAMLSMLAEIGAKAYPPASPVLEILNGLGNSLLNREHTDTEFRYTMILDPQGGSPRVNHFALEVGNYVLIRSEERGEEIDWDNLVLDENEGILYRWKDKKSPERYTDGTYVVIEINKNVSNVEVQLAQNDFSSLLESLKTEDKEKAATWATLDSSLKNVFIQRQQIKKFNRAKGLLGKIETLEDTNARKVEATRLFKMIANSVDPDGVPLDTSTPNDKHSYDLSGEQIEYLIDSLWEIGRIQKRIEPVNQLLLSNKKIYEGFGTKKKDGNPRDLKDPAVVTTMNKTRDAILNLVCND